MPSSSSDRDGPVDAPAPATGVPAHGQFGAGSYSPTGGAGQRNWQEATISEPGLNDRGNVFFAAVEMTRMPMILTDPTKADNPIIFANRAFQDLTGYESEEVLGRNCRFLQGARTDPERVQELRDAVKQQRAIAVEILNYKRDGTPFWNAVYIAPVYDEAGKLIYFFASQLDVTRRRTSEAAFRQAQKMESIGQLTAGLAHDFNNLLQVIQGNLERLRDRVEDDRMRRYIDHAASASDRGAKLTKQLLAFARKTHLEARPTDLNALINEFGEMLESTAGSRIDLEFVLRRRLPPTMVDSTHLEMALLNVLINARDAMPNGGRITISTRAVHLAAAEAGEDPSPAGDYVELAISDEGEGMPAHVLERATEPFFTTKETGKGTGLGLAMVYGFVQQSLGRLEIDSEIGRGTTVRMLFPVSLEKAESLRPAAQAPAASDHRGNAETILVVEDNDDVLQVACENLQSLGYRILTARSGNEALEIYEKARSDGHQIDLLFTDLVMPGSINGLILADRLKQANPSLPVLLTTGYNEDLVAHGPRAPNMDVLGKPYRRSELADRVRAALNRQFEGERLQMPVSPGPRHEG